MPEDQRKREAVLRAYRGDALPEIATSLGTSTSEVEAWIAELAQDVRSAPTPVRSRRRDDRRPLAQTLLASREFVRVSKPEEEKGEADLLVFFDDLAAHEFPDLVEGSVAVVLAVEGVETAWHEDRELICAKGRASPASVQDPLLHWWERQLQMIVERP